MIVCVSDKNQNYSNVTKLLVKPNQNRTEKISNLKSKCKR